MLIDILKLEQAALAAQAEHRYESAINLHAEAITLTQNLERPRLKAVLFSRLGRALEADGQVQKAVVAYEIGFQFLGTEGKPDIQAVVESLRTVRKQFSGERQLALNALFSPDMATALEEAETDPLLAVKLLINIGNAYLRQPQEYPALNAYEQALARPEIGQTPSLRAHAMTHLGIIRRRLGDLEAAGSLLHEALALLQKHASPTEQRITLAALASLYRDKNEPDRAFNSYQQALDLYAQVNDLRGTARTQIGLARLYLKQDRLDVAGQTFRQALALAEQVGDQEAQWHAHAGLAQVQEKTGDLEQAVVSLRHSLHLIEERQDELRTDQGKASFLDSILEIFDQLLAVHLQQAKNEPQAYAEALAVAESSRAQALLDLMNHRRRRRLPAAQTVRPARQRPYADRLANLPDPADSSRPDSPVQTARGTVLDSAAQAAPGVSLSPGVPSDPADFDLVAQHALHHPVETVGQASRLAPSTRSAATPSPDQEDIATEAPDSPQLPPLARLIFHPLPDQTAIFAVTLAGKVYGHVAAIGEQTLTKQVAQLRQVLKVDNAPRGIRGLVWGDATEPDDETTYETLLRELYTILIAPVADVLPADGTPVVIEPQGPLWLLPFAALQASDGTWLADHWPLLYAPSAQALAEIRREPDYGSPANLKVLIVGNPTMPQVKLADDRSIELEPLSGAEEEAKAIAELFAKRQRKLLLGAAADRLTVEREATQRGILHLATHGLADANDPLASFVALAEAVDGHGLLTARQVLDLKLPADLVTLSACQTGLGKISGDGMIGLSRAFLVAGARAVLVSQWSISDEATVALMTAFYRHYISLDDKALALQQAMREVRSQPEYEHPRYWAPFMVVGAEA